MKQSNCWFDMAATLKSWSSCPYRKPRKTDGKPYQSSGGACSDKTFVTLDLGDLHAIGAVTLINYFGDGRRSQCQSLALSVTGEFGGEEKVVWQTKGSEWGPVQTKEGIRHEFPEVRSPIASSAPCGPLCILPDFSISLMLDYVTCRY